MEPGLDTFSVSGFGVRPVDVEARLDFPEAPSGPGGGAARSDEGETISFILRNRFTFVQTDATAFDRHGTARFVPDSSGSAVTLSDVAVPNAIPLPAAAYAGACGLVMVAGYCRRLRRRQQHG